MYGIYSSFTSPLPYDDHSKVASNQVLGEKFSNVFWKMKLVEAAFFL
jgi:hypothetical protein